MLPFEITKNGLSSFLGYASIGCWLCAQVPQVVENIRLQSCDGLALPFLMTWLGGDLTNLIGCLLTDQLPFQTYLASYFCCVDILLTSQFIYYRRRNQPRKSSTLPKSRRLLTPNMSASFHTATSAFPSPHLRTRSATHVPPTSRVGSHSQSMSSSGQLPTSSASTARPSRGHRPSSSSHTTDTLAALQEAAMDVVRAAERVQERSRSRRRATSRIRSAFASAGGPRRPGGPSRKESESTDDNGGTSGDGMMDSFYSEASGSSSVTSPRKSSGRGKGKGRDFVSEESSPVLSTTEFRDSRGRPLRRMLETVDSDVGEGEGESSLTVRHYGVIGIEGLPSNTNLGDPMSRSVQIESERDQRRRKSKSRSRSVIRTSSGRAAGVLFMGVFALLGFGRLEPDGWKPEARGLETLRSGIRHPAWDLKAKKGNLLWETSEISQTVGNHTLVRLEEEEDEEPEPHWPEAPTAQRIIGRTSAWACTTLYLTSRLPQIWKNFNRKSVEGLSIMLFVFAFFGNLTYVVSILLNPSGSADPSEAAHYLLESLPYLLGSGGTLLFDVTIMIQAILYRNSSPIIDTEGNPTNRRSSRRRTKELLSTTEEEEEPLIRERSVHRSLSTDSAVLSAMKKAGTAIGDRKQRSLSRQGRSKVARVMNGDEALGLERGQSVGMKQAKGWDVSPVRTKSNTDAWSGD